MKGIKIRQWTLFLLLFFTNAFGTGREIANCIWGKPAPASLYISMWAWHLYDLHDHLHQTDLLAFTYNGYYGGTYVNCFKDRCYSVGLQRCCFNRPVGKYFDSYLGYRLGLLYGYDERLSTIAGKMKIIPCLQLIYDINYKNFGFELSTTGLLLLGGFFIRF